MMQKIISLIIRNIFRVALSLRYSISISGLDAITAKGRKGILLLPNHPALIDPVILMSRLNGPFAPQVIADKNQIDRFLIRRVTPILGIIPIPSIERYGPQAKPDIEKVFNHTIENLCHGKNLLLWPAGHIYRGFLEDLRSNSSIERVLRQCPDVRIVLIRTRGLWGSAFSFASGKKPDVPKILSKGFFCLLANGIFFTPRRKVTIEFYEPSDFPRTADRNTINDYLEKYYNENALHNTYVPYTIWQKGGSLILPEPPALRNANNSASPPPATRQIVLKYLSELTGISKIADTDYLGRDLGMDSLARTDLAIWLEKEFGYSLPNPDAMKTVADCFLAASGHLVSVAAELNPVPPRWFADNGHDKLTLPPGQTITEVFLKQAKLNPSKIIVADQSSGTKSRRDIVTACLLLKPVLEKIDGTYLGIMLPAAVAAETIYIACLFAGKAPVMVNWTLGPANMTKPLERLAVKHILTAKAMVEKISAQGTDVSAIMDRFIFLEDLAAGFSAFKKFQALLLSYISWSSLYNAKISKTAAVLFTSGSETQPKAVPLSHANVLANLKDTFDFASLRDNDRLIGFLPPFHSFGLTVTILGPLCAGLRTVYYPNPMDAATLAQIIAAYRVTLLVGTPTILNNVVLASVNEQLASLRLAVTGAEKCSEKVYAALSQNCRNAVVIEGYGVTECSPIISINDINDPQPFTIGKILPSFEYLLIDPQTSQPLSAPGTGILLVRGPSVFNGYLNFDGPSPFVRIQDKNWYSTGDLVSVDEKGVFTFQGRLKRFIKLAGEMISLPAIEAVLESHLSKQTDEGPVLAVEASSDQLNPELVLFTTLQIDRETVNRYIRQAGLSGLHNIRRIITLDQFPLLGTGKIDYRSLKEKINTPQSS